VKLLKAGAQRLTFSISRQEKQLLFRVLEFYPLIPETHHRLSRTEDRPDDQKLLEEALAHQRAQLKQQVAAWKKARAGLCRKNPRGRLALKPAEVNWLLQVLNDIRVGSWLALDSPDGPAEIIAALNEKTARHFWLMEAAGGFQTVLLMATNGGE